MLKLLKKVFFRCLSDKQYLKVRYYLTFKKKLNLKNPQTFNEKLQWLKLYDKKDIYTMMVDKYEVKKYIANTIGQEYVIPTLRIYDKFDDIDFSKLPKQFVMKCTHDSGGLVIVKDKAKLDKEKAKAKLEKSLKYNYYYGGREWPYKNVKPRILVEEYMEDAETQELRDYKFFCFDGIPKFMFIATGRQKNDTRFNFYDLDFNLLPFIQGHPNDESPNLKPKNFDKMLELSKELAKDIPHVRVDFYEINNKVYFGELTFYHYSGFTRFEPEEWDYKLGELIKLPERGDSDAK